MKKLQSFVQRSLFGGVVVILPIAILAFFIQWLFNFVTDLLAPLTRALINQYALPELTADLLAIASMVVLCFLVGSLVQTGIGKWLHRHFDDYLVKLAPGYRMIKDIINQFFGSKDDSPFAQGVVARARIYGPASDAEVTALITSRHPDGRYTVFVPTGPNPTSGMMFHLPAELVEPLPDIKVDEAMRTIISCGAGSAELFNRPAVSTADIKTG